MASKVVKIADAKGINEEHGSADTEIMFQAPYRVLIGVQGMSDILFHRWNPAAIKEKAGAAKGSAAKKTDNVESYIYRFDGKTIQGGPEGNLCIPGEYMRGSIVNSAKFFQDPRSPRKSAMDLFKAGVVPLTMYADLGQSNWDYEDERRVVVQRAGINRVRPALRVGWKVEFEFMVTTPEYINLSLLHQVVTRAGQLVGLGDFRPTFGRYGITAFKELKDDEGLGVGARR